jgi:hypothetical protein
LEHGLIEISDLQTFPTYATDDPSVNGDTASIQSFQTSQPRQVPLLVQWALPSSWPTW